ncbi:SRPBCC domain-containing protein [Hyalangium sp.]|uniref:SRPBCC family protein n=1 Tax=Hyalangium sp. TaxID=2028555 RepID=UPI002D567EFB|nr:SRPBCC domain-containing protein [Hyalangium sp.]HYI00012.1 SRPBCC domain-containing protein [Hyalangium sp.]
MSELVMKVRMAQTLEQISAAFEDPFLLRRWYGAPPGCHRLGGAGSLAPGEAFQVQLIDAEGTPFTQLGRVLSVTPGEGFEMELGWEGGQLGREVTRASMTLRAVEGVTYLELRQGPFSSQEALEAHQAYWEACLGRLARVASGEAVPCFEEFWEESHGFVEPLGMAAYTVLAGLREAGAAPEVIAQVEEALYAHLARVPEEIAGVLGAVLRGRLKEAAA